MRYIVFLRGINVSGNQMIKMEELKRSFESLGFTNVQTVLASGNIIVESKETNISSLAKKLEENLAKTFGYQTDILLREDGEIKNLISSNPFKNKTIIPRMKCYVTFLSEVSKNNLKIPYKSPQKYFEILQVTDREVCSILTLSPNSQTTDLMKFLEKEFGKKITTRNWNTIIRIGKLLN